jgi:NAD(P)-dependent dehydrogenase (short-subunit alcohol dehydrogenase family)
LLTLFSSVKGDAPVALVTGGSRGIGAGIACGFASAGARVAVNFTQPSEGLRETMQRIRESGAEAMEAQADVADSAQVNAMVEGVIRRFGRIDTVVLNAGICPFMDFLEMPEDLWDRVIDVNLKGSFLVGQAVARHMVERGGGGRVVAVGSISSLVGGTKQAHYCSSKAGQNLLIKSMALSLAPYGITCNSVLPGTVETDINREALKDETLRARLVAGTPVGRLGCPQDIVGAVLYLASEEAAWTTGSLVVVDGGATSTLQ